MKKTTFYTPPEMARFLAEAESLQELSHIASIIHDYRHKWQHIDLLTFQQMIKLKNKELQS